MVWGKEQDARWQQLTEEVITGMKEWRLQHPKATLTEIERALDERLGKVRARMLQDVAMTSAAVAVSQAQERPRCPQCGQPMEGHGQDSRTLVTNYNQAIKLTRGYAQCPVCQTRLFPPG